MLIPKGKNALLKFVRDRVEECLISQTERINRDIMFTNYAMSGSENPSDAALFNKTYAYLDDLESLLYSPISLRFHISDPDLPNVLAEAKGRAAAAKLRAFARQSDTDTMISEAVFWALVKGKTLIKQMWHRDNFLPVLVQPGNFGVFSENRTKLDSDMECFVHSQLITPYQFRRLIWDKSDKDELWRKSKRHMRDAKGALSSTDASQKQVIVGGLYPFQPAGSNTPAKTRGIVDWMQGPSPMLSPKQEDALLQLDELWVWDDERSDWATFQIVGPDVLVLGRMLIKNAYAWNPQTRQEDQYLKGAHPFHEICCNRLDGYFWGRSEIINVALLQECLNSRLNGINKILRLQEDPPTTFIGATGVNQAAIAKFRKPGGYIQDGNPNAKIQSQPPPLDPNLWAGLKEVERLFDDMGGLPPIAKGHGESGVRSQGHAETLVRMFSPRFKDRAILIERDVEGLGASMLDVCKAKVAKKMLAWLPQDQAGIEGIDKNPLLVPPVANQVPVSFRFSDLDDDQILTVDSHSSSPAFSEEAKSLVFALFKIGAMSAEDVLYHVDAPDPEELAAGLQRRQAAAAEDKKEQLQVQLIKGGKK